jgi:hypothetical protein
MPLLIPSALYQGPIAKPKDLNISDEGWAKLCERVRAARAAAYADDPQYVEKLWYAYSRSLFNFMLKEYCQSLPLVVPPTDGSDQELSEKGEVL